MNWSLSQIKKDARSVIKPDYWHIWFASALIVVLSYITVISFMLNSMEEIPGTIKNISSKIGQSSREQILAVILVLTMGVFLLNSLIQITVSVFVKNPIRIGAYRMFLHIYSEETHKGKAADIMFIFDNSYRNVIYIMLVKAIRQIVFYILLIVPGLWRTYTYRLVPYILAQKPETKIEDAFTQSIQMMKGQKWKVFLYDLSFIPWHILGFLTFGVVELFWVHPYKNMADALVYKKISEIYDWEEN